MRRVTQITRPTRAIESVCRRARAVSIAAAGTSHVDLAFTDWKLGLTDSNSFESSARDFFNLLQTPGANAYWRHRSANHARPFRDYVIDTVFQGQEPEKSEG